MTSCVGIFQFNNFILDKQRRKKENSRRCEFCNVNVHGASYGKHLRSEKHLENLKIIPEWFFQEPIENINEEIFNPNLLKRIAREIIKINDKEWDKGLNKKRFNHIISTMKV